MIYKWVVRVLLHKLKSKKNKNDIQVCRLCAATQANSLFSLCGSTQASHAQFCVYIICMLYCLLTSTCVATHKPHTIIYVLFIYQHERGRMVKIYIYMGSSSQTKPTYIIFLYVDRIAPHQQKTQWTPLCSVMQCVACILPRINSICIFPACISLLKIDYLYISQIIQKILTPPPRLLSKAT